MKENKGMYFYFLLSISNKFIFIL